MYTSLQFSFEHKTAYITLKLEGHPNRITGSRVTAILLNEWILPIAGAEKYIQKTFFF